MKKIEEALEDEITRGDCNNCPRLWKDESGDYCDVTEELIGSGNEYCELTPITNK